MRAGRPALIDLVKVEPHELVHHAARRRFLKRQVRLLGDACDCEHESEWMPTSDAVEPGRLRIPDSEPLEQPCRLVVAQRPERHASKAGREGEPGGDRGLAAHEEDALAGRESGCELLPEPSVHEPEHLVVV